jgi:hypothetical protein
VATILHSILRMKIQHTLIRVICSGVVLGTVIGARPALSVAAPAGSDPHQSLADCEDWKHRAQESATSDNPCVSPPAVRAEEELRDRSRAEEQGGLHWQPLEPAGRDLSLWYYPGAPRPLWGY